MKKASKKKVVIIGAGPAGLTAGYQLIKNGIFEILILDAETKVGGLSKTIDYKGNKIDIGGHRFFSKSEKVVDWWADILGIESDLSNFEMSYKGNNSFVRVKKRKNGELMVRSRLSRIYFENRLLDYPLRIDSMFKLGWLKLAGFGLSYFKAILLPRRERNLEDFFINRFGWQLYQRFFKSYSEKVWGASCDQISADWGRQRVKSLSIKEAIVDLIIRKIPILKSWWIKKKPTTLTEYFLYPKLGPGQMWETVAQKINKEGGEIMKNSMVEKIVWGGTEIKSVIVNGKEFRGDDYISTMAISDLIKAMGQTVPEKIKKLSQNLNYREFVVVGVLLKDLIIKDDEGVDIKDNWIYIHDNNVKVGRIQFFHNWSIDLVKDKNHKWLGLEYWCNKGDEMWMRSEDDWEKIAIVELEKLKIGRVDDVIDMVVIKVEKAYPVYSGSYNEFGEIKNWLNNFGNLYCVGRNGMHRYNNQDHSMLTAMKAVDLIASGDRNKDKIWEINTDDSYVESK